MDDLRSALASLDPPIKHRVMFRDNVMHLTFIDSEINATADRDIAPWQYEDRDVLHVILLHAIHELQRKGSHAPLKKLPLVQGKPIDFSNF